MAFKTYLKNFFRRPEDKDAQLELEAKIYYHRRAVAEAKIESMVPGLKGKVCMVEALELIAKKLEELTQGDLK